MLSVAIIKFIVCSSIFSSIAAIKVENSLAGPYDTSGPNLPFWEVSGSAQLTNSYIRLTPDENEKKGSLWNIYPCSQNNWEMQTQFHIHGKGVNLYGDGLAIWYAKEPLQTGPVFGYKDFFSGLGIFIDTYENQREAHKAQFPYIYGMVNNGSFHYANEEDGAMTKIGGCHANVRNVEVPTRIAISYINNNLGVYLDTEGTGHWKECFTFFGLFLPTAYFLGLTASTSEYSDNHDIISVTTLNLDTPEMQWEDKSNIMPFAVNVEIPEKYHKYFIEKNQAHKEMHVQKREAEEDASVKDSHEDKSSEEEIQSAEKHHHIETEENKHSDEVKKVHHSETKADIKHGEPKEADKKHVDEAQTSYKDTSKSPPSFSWFKMFIYITGGGILIMVAISMYKKYSERRQEILHKRLF